MRWGKSRWGVERWGGTGTPGTVGEFFRLDAWDRERHLGTGSTITLPVTEGEDAISIEVAASRTAFYTIEIYDDEGEKLGAVPHFLDGGYGATLGEAGVLQFEIEGDDPALSLLVHPNRVWLRDRWGLVLDRFHLRKKRLYRRGDARYVAIEAQSLIVGLQREPVVSYSALATVAEHVAALLALQVGGAIEVDEIEEPIASTSLWLEAEATTIMATLNKLRLALPLADRGHFYVSGSDKFRWRHSIGPTDRKLLIGKNLIGIEYSANDDDLVTRLYMYGEGQDGNTRVSLVDAGEANPYIEQNVGTYGVVPMVKIDRRILHPETLLARAQAILAEFSTPRVEIRVDVLDLAAADAEGFDEYGNYYIGAQYQAVDEEQGIDETVTVQRLEYDLAQPVPVRMDLANRTRSMADAFRSLDERIPASTDVTEDGRYPNIARITREAEDAWDYIDGDLRKLDGGLPQYWEDDTDEWKDIGGGAGLSDEVPEAVADGDVEGAAGEATDAARADHTHERYTQLAYFPDIPESGYREFWHTGSEPKPQAFGARSEDEDWTPLWDFCTDDTSPNPPE